MINKFTPRPVPGIAGIPGRPACHGQDFTTPDVHHYKGPGFRPQPLHLALQVIFRPELDILAQGQGKSVIRSHAKGG